MLTKAEDVLIVRARDRKALEKVQFRHLQAVGALGLLQQGCEVRVVIALQLTQRRQGGDGERPARRGQFEVHRQARGG